MTVRPAQPDDAPAMSRVRVDTWRATYRGLLPDATLDGLSYSDGEQFLRRILWQEKSSNFAFVAENAAGQVVGVAIAGPARPDPAAQPQAGWRGEVYVLYVLPQYQGQGHGRALLQACLRQLAQRGLFPAVLWTLAEGPARSFYARLGGSPAGEKLEEDGGQWVREVAYRWLDKGLYS